MGRIEIFQDEFQEEFSKQSEFLDFLQEREANGTWSREKTTALQFIAVEGNGATRSFNDIMQEFENAGQKEVLNDTIKNTCLLLQKERELLPIRSCAVKTILERARINGGALSKVKKPVLANILNECMKVAKGTALLRYCDNKISAIHAGDDCDYAILSMSELFQNTVSFLESNYPGYVFKNARFDHSLTTALWTLPKQPELIDVYQAELIKQGKSISDIVPAIRLTTSDVGISGANLYPFIYNGKSGIPMGNTIKLEHKNGANFKKFGENLNMIYAQYVKAIKGLAGLLTIEINYPINTMIGVMKRIGIPKKYGMEVIEIFKHQMQEATCTAHDIYIGITEAVYMLQCFGGTPTQVATMEENVARALAVKWSDYDMPGEEIW